MRHLCTLFVLASLSAQDPVQAPPKAPFTPTVTALPQAVAFNAAGETVLSPRIKQITKLHNTLPHKLTGIGIVTGLKQGSSDRGTRLAMLNMVRRLGLNELIQDVIGGSTTLVMVNGDLPPFAKKGYTLDVDVSSVTDAVSLREGVLQTCELRGVDGELYAVASGKLMVPGFTAGTDQAKLDKNAISVTATLMNGALVVRDNPSSYFSESGAIELRLSNPSPFNAMSVGNGISRALDGTDAKVSVVDMSLVRIELPEEQRTEENANQLVAFVGDVRVAVENPAKVTIDQSSGVVLAGEGVLISPCVVGLSEITIAVTTDPYVSQPNAFSNGTTEIVNRTSVEVKEESTELKKVSGGATVADLLTNLKALGMKPSQLVSVFVALDKHGFLHADLEVR
ncbi:MAG: flagellar basal body P-ring protein FlgI [Planctomycetes bacterium]|nr:flagellar basal body P-ring protein FlgI [Planctomycetota bacterium]MCB9884568.1 flagellar basal body P-ring protein FlgI [Planctomycetota bacterium]